MKLEFLFLSTEDLNASLAFYRDVLGFTELWREGETTAALISPDSGVQIMLDTDRDAPAGPVFAVESVTGFHETRPETLIVRAEPAEIPGGFWAVYQEPGGTTIYLVDQSTDSSES